MIIKDINNLSIKELKQLLAQVNHDLKMNKPTIKRAERIKQEKPALSELAECNIIAAKFTGNKQVNPVQNAKLIADIQIQKDILDFLNNGGRIITAKTRNKVKCQTFRNNAYSVFNKGAKAGNIGARNFKA